MAYLKIFLIQAQISSKLFQLLWTEKHQVLLCVFSVL